MQLLTNITDTSLFIDRGYWTAPLGGKHIIRDDKGKKKGFNFFTSWKELYSKTRNQVPSRIGVILTGKGKGIVAIDCDCTKSYNLFKALDPTNTAVAVSVGKLDQEGTPIECGTFLYKYDDTLPSNKSMKGQYDIDYINGVNSIFLPTEQNKTKLSWKEDEEGNLYNHDEQLVAINPMPQLVKDTLEAIIGFKESEAEQSKNVSKTIYNQRARGYLGRILPNLDMEEGLYNPEVTKLLTPRELRTKLYQSQGHLHPNDIDGGYHNYLFSIACNLAGDNSVDPQLATDTIEYINNLGDDPIPHKKLHQQVIDGIVSGRQLNQYGEPYWRYDENWESLRSWTAVAKTDGDLVDIFYDQYNKDYYVYNTQTDHIMIFTKRGDLFDHISATTIEAYNQKEVIADMSNVATTVEPTEDFGYIDDDKSFNLFKPTKALRILSDPTLHEHKYKEPIEFINYMEHFIPDEQQRTYFLSLLRTKLTTFKYSPVVPYIIGIAGSGKGVLMTILENIMGSSYVSKEVSGGIFVSQFNKGWLEHKFFVNLNELAEGLTTRAERTKALGDLKLYTGSTSFQCHGKGRDAYTAPQKAMFIMTANHNPLAIEDTDRRVYYISTPNTFNSSPQCQASVSSDDIHHTIMTQTEDIAYWLATEVKNLVGNDYTTAPHHAGRNTIIFESLPISEKLVWALNRKEFKLLDNYLYEPIELFEHAGEGRIYLDNLVNAYNQIGNQENIDKILMGLMKKYGFRHKYVNNRAYWNIEGLNFFEDYAKKPPVDEEELKIRT